MSSCTGSHVLPAAVLNHFALLLCPTPQVGLTEDQAIEQLHGEIDVYISRFKPMKNTLRCAAYVTLV